jgi:hypothetical protein
MKWVAESGQVGCLPEFHESFEFKKDAIEALKTLWELSVYRCRQLASLEYLGPKIMAKILSANADHCTQYIQIYKSDIEEEEDNG